MLKAKFLLLFIVVFCQLIFAQQNRVEKIDSLLNSLAKKNQINGNVLIAEKGEVIYKNSFGLANEADNVKLDENSIFELASVSKQFTAMAIVVLKEKGQLSYNDNLDKFFPELSFYKNVTVRNLLNHTGGLPDYMQLMDSLFDKTKIATNKDVIELFAKHKPAILFAPNTKYEYSNTGYALLASIVEKASKKSFGNFLKENIFEPLSMANSFVYTRRYKPKKVKNYAYGYVFSDSLKKYILPDDNDDTKMVVWLDGIVGDGAVNSTIGDLLKWDRALYANQLVSVESMNEIFTAPTLADNSKSNYGFGWSIDDNKDFGKIVSHSGGWPGYTSYIERNITNDKTVIILQNRSEVAVPSKTIRLILFNKPLPTKKERKEIKLPVEKLQKFVGVYNLNEEAAITVTLDKEQLTAQLTGQRAFPIFPESELFFFLKVVDAQLQFEKNDAGEITHLFLLQNGNKIRGDKQK